MPTLRTDGLAISEAVEAEPARRTVPLTCRVVSRPPTGLTMWQPFCQLGRRCHIEEITRLLLLRFGFTRRAPGNNTITSGFAIFLKLSVSGR